MTSMTYADLDDDEITRSPHKAAIERLSRDLAAAGRTMGPREARFLVDAYYQSQENRKRAANQARAMERIATEAGLAPEPHVLIDWLFSQSHILEAQIRRALDHYTQGHMMGSWMRCAPGHAEVWVEKRRRVRLDQLHGGDRVISFDRHHARLTRPMPIEVASRSYVGDLIETRTVDHATETTPNHRWLLRFNPKAEGVSVYLMRSGDRFRVGRAALFIRRNQEYMRLGVQPRARNEQADVWILKVCSTDREAAIYEHFVSAHYGLTECCFRQNRPGGRLGMSQDELDQLFLMFDTAQQYERASLCLEDHGRSIEAPLWSWRGDAYVQSPTQGIFTHAANIIPEVMQVPVPTPLYAGVDWLNIQSAERYPYAGPVYSLDVANHHKYIQDGVITCNSIVGIGPVISAGMLANLETPRSTAGKVYAFAGLASDGQKQWKSGEKRPYNARLKTLCWHAGQSFMKLSAREDCFYGRLYRERKAYEQARSDSGAMAETAAQWLPKVGKSTEAYKHYAAGHLPPSQIDGRARRYAVKLFLSHMNEVWLLRTGQTPPAPFAIGRLGHSDYIPPPIPA